MQQKDFTRNIHIAHANQKLYYISKKLWGERGRRGGTLVVPIFLNLSLSLLFQQKNAVMIALVITVPFFSACSESQGKLLVLIFRQLARALIQARRERGLKKKQPTQLSCTAATRSFLSLTVGHKQQSPAVTWPEWVIALHIKPK